MNTHIPNHAQTRPTKKQAEAYARFQIRNNQTCMIDRYATAPLKWSKTFLDGKHGAVYLYLQDVSPGMLDGDHYRVQIELEPGCDVSIRTTTYGKIHPCPHHGIQLDQTIRLREARLSYCPEPMIPYTDARLRSTTMIDLDLKSQLFWTESWAPGRVHKGESFDYAEVSSELTILRDGNYLVWDPFSFRPNIHSSKEKGAWETFSHCGSIWIIDPQAANDFWQHLMEQVRIWGGTADGEWPDEKMAIANSSPNHGSDSSDFALRMAISRIDGPGVSIRILSNQAERIQQTIHRVWEFTRKYAWNQQTPPWQAPGEHFI